MGHLIKTRPHGAKRGVVKDGLILVFVKYQNCPEEWRRVEKDSLIAVLSRISITVTPKFPKSVTLLLHCSSASSQTTAWRESVMMLLLFGVLLLLELEKTVSSVIRLSPPLSCRQSRWLGRVVRSGLRWLHIGG